MKLVLPDKIIFQNDPNGKYIIYFPDLFKLIKVNKILYECIKILHSYNDEEARLSIEQILKDNGTITYDQFIAYLFSKGVLFRSAEELEKVITNIKSKYANEGKPTLDIVYLHLTFKCNFSCKYCYNRANLNEGNEKNTEFWKGVIDYLCENYNTKKIIFTGGEPLLRKDLFEVLQYAKMKKGLCIEVLTNGSLLESCINKIEEYVDYFVISLDSLDFEENRINRSSIMFKDIINFLINLPENTKKKMTVRSVITKTNLKSYKKFCEFFKSIGIRTVHTRFIPNNISEITEVPEAITVELDDNIRFNLSNYMYRCGAGRSIIAIAPDGTVYPCQSLIMKEFKMGNISPNGLVIDKDQSYILNELMHTNVNNIESCDACEIRYICGGGCPAISYKLFGSVNKQIAYACDELKCNAYQRLKYMKWS